MKSLRFILILIVVLFAVHQCQAGAWNKEKGHGYFQFSFTYLAYDQLLNGLDDKIDLKRSIGDYTFQVYGEYGLSKKLNLILNLPYKMVSSSENLNQVENDPYINDTLDAGKMDGLSNLGLGLKYNITEGNYVLAAQMDFQSRNHQYQDNSGLQIGYDAYVISPSILYGKGWSKYYFQAQAGLSFFTNNYAQVSFGNLEIGRSFWEGKSYLIFRTDIKLPITQGSFNERNSVQTGLFRDNSSFISPGAKWIQKLNENFYLNLGIYGAFFSELEGAHATYNFGLAYEW